MFCQGFKSSSRGVWGTLWDSKEFSGYFQNTREKDAITHLTKTRGAMVAFITLIFTTY